MMEMIALGLLGAAAIGSALVLIALGALCAQVRQSAPARPARPMGISILKPLCGLDDDLYENLERFATLPYPRYEVLLGLEDANDPAAPLARLLSARHPGRVRLCVQRGEPGLNPKVNQLLTLAQAARHEVLVVSDSNIAVSADYLDEIAGHLADPGVGLVTHLIAGAGGERLGALCDNLQLSGSVAPGVAGAQRVAGKSLVVGKSMALRRGDLAALGGFAAVKDVLAEDYVLGRAVVERLGKRVALAARPVHNVARRQTIGVFLARWRRWSIIHRKAVGPLVYAGELLLCPVLLAALACAVSPSRRTALALAAAVALRILCDRTATRALGLPPLRRLAFLASAVRELLVGLAWLHGLVHDTVVWRGHVRRVLGGTRLAPLGPDGRELEARVRRAA